MDKQALAILKAKISQELKQNPCWQFKTLDNYWICPYCGTIGARFDVPEKMLTEVMGHFVKICPEWKKKGKLQLSLPTLKNIRKAQNWLRTWGKKSNFRFVDDKNRWYCPHCAQRQKIFIDFSNPATAQIIEIIGHIESCSEQKSGKPPLNSEQVELALKLRRDRRFLFYNRKDNTWFSPWTLKLTGIKRTESEKITRNQVVATAVHYQGIKDSFGEDVKPAEIEVIERSLKDEREKEKLLAQIRHNIFKDKIWQVLSERDFWICPYCRKEIKEIDFNTGLSKKEVAPLQIFQHLTEACQEHKTGKKPAQNVEGLASKKEGGKQTSYQQSLSTFMSLVENETAKYAMTDDEKQTTDGFVSSKRDEYNRQMLEKAKNVQLMMLPAVPKIEGLDFAVNYRSCDELSGDFYDFFQVSDHELGIVVGDVSGHGVTAALVMAATKKALKLTSKGKKPKETMLIVNDEIKSELPMAVFITIFYGVLNLKTYELCHVRAGHNPLYIYNSQRTPCFNEYLAKGMIIGTAPSSMLEKVLEEETIQLYQGDLVVQYTDGVVEAMNPAREEYSEERLKKFICDNYNQSAEELVTSLADSVDKFYDGAEPNDDVTIVALKIP